MTRYAALASAVVLVALATGARAAEQEKPHTRPVLPVVGMLVKVGANSISVQPRSSPRAKAVPAVRVFAVGKDKTEVGMSDMKSGRRMDDGTLVHAYWNPVPGDLTDLKVGQNVEVTFAEGEATNVIIVWPTPGTLTKLASASIGFRADPPAASGPAVGGPATKPAAAAEEETIAVDRDTTRVYFKVTERLRQTPSGEAINLYRITPATLNDLKEGQAIGLCAKRGEAIKIFIIVPPDDAK